VLNSVRGCICNSEAARVRQLYEVSMMSQVNYGFSGLMRSQAALLILVVLMVGGVIMPAVWSSKKARRTAALDVLDRVIRFDE
jgi:hypothetical protein